MTSSPTHTEPDNSYPVASQKRGQAGYLEWKSRKEEEVVQRKGQGQGSPRSCPRQDDLRPHPERSSDLQVHLTVDLNREAEDQR